MSAVAEPIFAGRFDHGCVLTQSGDMGGNAEGAGEKESSGRRRRGGPPPEAGERERRLDKPQL